MNLNEILSELKQGKLETVYQVENIREVNEYVQMALQLDDWDKEITDTVEMILTISNILYNNTSRSNILLDDGVYDMLLAKFNNKGNVFYPGAEPIRFDESGSIHRPNGKKEGLKDPPFKIITDFADMTFYDEIIKNDHANDFDPSTIPPWGIHRDVLNIRNVPHSNKELVGTLDKCKFVLNKDAKDMGVFDDSSVKIFERDFIGKHIQMGLYDSTSIQTLIAEFKYDGYGVEGIVKNGVLVSANTRGDTKNDKAKDLTPVLGGYQFPRAKNIDGEIGMQFEAIIMTPYLNHLSRIMNTRYANARNAVAGITSRLDAYLYRDYITLVPLKTDIIDDETGLHLDRLVEIEFLNKYFAREVNLKYAIMTGNYIENLYQVKKMVDEAYYMRQFMPFMYDGIVVSYYGDEIRQILGRKDFVDQYSVAIKFPAMEVDTIFLGYKYTIGLGGVITPMIYYKPVEFYGCVHDHSTGHSLKRFNELQLKAGDVIKVTYTNDVMPYVTKPDLDVNNSNPNPVIPFPTHCPVCGCPIEISSTGNSARCPNPECKGRRLARMVNMITKLEIRDFGQETIDKIQENLTVNSLVDLLNLTVEDVSFLGPNLSKMFIDRVHHLKNDPIYDYQIMGALGFTNVAEAKWRKILHEIALTYIIYDDPETLRYKLTSIKTIGPSVADTIIAEREAYMDDLDTILAMNNIIPSTGVQFGLKIRFTGIRDKNLVDVLSKEGYDIGEGSVTKDTDILIVPEAGYVSSKTKKAGPNTLIIPYQEFVSNLDKYLV